MTRRDFLIGSATTAAYFALPRWQSAMAYCTWEHKILPAGVEKNPWWSARLAVGDKRRRQNQFIPAAPVDSNRFTFGSDGTFTFFHISDVHHERKQMGAREKVFFDRMCQKFQPSLTIMTGDNTDWRCKGLFEDSVSEVVKLFTDERLPFAITFGNHDTEVVGEGWYTAAEQWDFYRKMGGRYFVERHDASVVGGGTSRIQVLDSDGRARFDLNVLDSGDYAPSDDIDTTTPPSADNWKHSGFDSVRAPQVAWARRTLAEGVPSLFFQHIIPPESHLPNGCGLLEPAREGEQPTAKFKYDGKEMLMRVNPKRAVGFIAEGFGSVPLERARNPVYLDNGESIYDVWKRAKNFRGVYVGHDHVNTMDGITLDGVRIGFSKTPSTCAYNDNDLGLRVFKLNRDGTYLTDIFSEKHPDGTRFWGKLSPM